MITKDRRRGTKSLYFGCIAFFILGLFFSFPVHCQWQRISIGTDKTLTHVSPVNGDTIYVSGFDGLFKTNDFGVTWNRLAIDDLPGSYFYKTHFFNSKMGLGVGPILMANSEVITKTYDGGYHWNVVNVTNGGGWPREFNDIEFTDSQNGYAIGKNGRVLITKNAGETWKAIISDGLTDYLDGSFYTANQGYVLSKHELKEIDSNGNLRTILKNKDLDFVALEALGKDEIIVSSKTKIYKTSDGINWSTVVLPFGKVTTMFVQSSEIIYLGTENGVFVTFNGGSRWECFKETLDTHTENIYLREDGKGFIVGGDGAIFETSNFGGSPVPYVKFSYSVERGCGYSYVHFNNDTHSSYSFQWFMNEQLVSTAFEDSIKITDSFSGNLTLVAANGLVADTVTQQVNIYVESLIADAGEDIYACYDEAVTLNAKKTGPYFYSWSPTTGLSDPKIANPISSHPTTIEYILTISTGNGCFQRDTVTVFRAEPLPAIAWEKMNVSTEWDIIHMQKLNDSLAFAKTVNRVLRSSDGGKNWSEMGNPGGFSHVGKVHFISADTGFVASRYLFKTTDGGKSYSKTYLEVTEIEFVNSKIGYVVTYSINNRSAIYKTSDGGESWEKQYENIGVIREIACIDVNNCTAVGSGEFYRPVIFLRTTDGKNWGKPNYDYSDHHGIFDISFVDSEIGFAIGANGMVWKTIDGGASWTINNKGPGGVMIKFFDRERGLIGSRNGYIYQTVNGGQCWQLMGKTPQEVIFDLYLYKNEAYFAGRDSSASLEYVHGSIHRAKFLKPQTINFEALEEKKFGEKGFRLAAQTSSGLPVSFTSSNNLVAKINGDLLSIFGAGTATITASQGGNDDYSPAISINQTLVVNKADQTINFSPPTDKTYGDSTVELIASASSGLAVTFEVEAGPAALTGNILKLTGTGTVTLKASQVGNSNFNATQVFQSFCVLPTEPVITDLGEILRSSSLSGNQWYLNGEKITGATHPTHHAKSSGDYSVSVTGPCGSAVPSSTFQFTIPASKAGFLNTIILYPNPATDHITIDLPEEIDHLSVRVINSLGIPIENPTPEDNGMVINLGKLKKGVYYLELKTSSETVVKKFIVQ